MRDMIPNLQLMEGRQNESKNAEDFETWLGKKEPSEQQHFKITNYIPENESLEFRNFKSFFEKRKTKLGEALRKVLAINNDAQITNEEFLEQETDVEQEVSALKQENL